MSIAALHIVAAIFLIQECFADDDDGGEPCILIATTWTASSAASGIVVLFTMILCHHPVHLNWSQPPPIAAS